MRNRVLLLVSLVAFPLLAQTPRTRARDVGIVVGVLPPGLLDAITDVAGVRVGHVTIAQGDSINTGVTAILPHDGNVFRDKVPAAIVVGNGFGKLMGATQVNASRRLPRRLGGWTIGVLVQSNFGGVLTINGAPVGQELGQYYLKGMVSRTTDDGERITADGSVILVVATDAPLDHRQLERLGRRALAGLARTGSSMSNGSGDYVISFSSRRIVGWSDRRMVPSDHPTIRLSDTIEVVSNDAMSPLFEAVIEAAEEAVYNSLLRAETVRGYRGTAPALPLDSTVAILRRHGAIRP